MLKLLLSSLLFCNAAAQHQLLQPQTDTWNSTFNLTRNLVARSANLTDDELNNIQVALRFEQSNWAGGSVADDEFYEPPSNVSGAAPGTVLKVQEYTNTSTYTLPPNTALSRMLYMSEDLNGTAIPTSAYILWPYLPRIQPDGTYPVITWAHGTSGFFRECAPSHIRNLWYQYNAPYILALAGYVVIGTDYAGLGVNSTADGTSIFHPYLQPESHGTDLLYAVQAARSAFPCLSQEFVVMGHSQGGSSAWGAAVRQAKVPLEGYLGTVTGSPTANLSALIKIITDEASASPARIFGWANALRGLQPTFNLSTILTETGVARFNLATELEICNSAIGQLLPGGSYSYLVQPDWLDVPEMASYISSADISTSPVAGPMLVFQGTEDPAVPESSTTALVNTLCDQYPETALEYWRFENVTHTPVLYASQRLWLDWIAERFASVGNATANTSGSGCKTTDFTSTPFSTKNYQKELGYFLELSTQPYQA